MSTPTPQKVSEITINDLADYLRIAELTDEDKSLLTNILAGAKSYILKYTGLKIEEVDNCPDITIALFVLAQDMYDNRAYYVDNQKVNKVVEGILSLYSVNLL